MNRLRVDLGESNNYYALFRKVFETMSAEEFYTKYSVDEIRDYFKDDKYNLYKLIVSSFSNDLNKKYIYNHLLEDDDFFNLFFEEQDNYYSMFDKLDYETALKIINKLKPLKEKYDSYIIRGLSEDDQTAILDEIDIETIPWFLKNVNSKVREDFFRSNKKAYYVIGKVPLSYLETKLSDDILFSSRFFELIKSYSIINFRTVVNKIEQQNPNPLFEKKVEEYEESIIDSYDSKEEIFEFYKHLTEENIVDEATSSKEKYLLSLVDLHYIKNIDTYFKEKTKEKLKELIIDYLFKDNHYNVSLNIKEILRYQKQEKTISDENRKFYELILNLDNISSENLIKIFKKYKDSNISLQFYQDIRNSKNRSYLKLNESLLKTDKNIELNGEPFTILVRGSNAFSNRYKYTRGCYSIIDEDNISVLGGYAFYYGYTDINIDEIIHNYENDSYSSDQLVEERIVNRIMSPKEITRIKDYSEIQIKNNNTLMPSYIVVFNEIEESHIEESKRLNIPIVLINTEYYKCGLETTHNLLTSVEDGFRYINDESEWTRVRRTL